MADSQFRDLVVPPHLRMNGREPIAIPMETPRHLNPPGRCLPPRQAGDTPRAVPASPQDRPRLRIPGSTLPLPDRQAQRVEQEPPPPAHLNTETRTLAALRAHPGQGRGALLLTLGLPDDERTRRDISAALGKLRRKGQIYSDGSYWYPAETTEASS